MAGPALACTSIATLNLGETQGAPGTDVSVTGSSFATIANGGSAVSVRWNGTDGPVLAQVAPDPSGSINASIRIPAGVEPGYYVLTATQTDKNGATAFGTPARAAFQVAVPGSSVTTPQQAADAVATAPSTDLFGLGAGTVALLAALGALGLMLFGVGAASFVSTLRQPVASPARKR
ncbi:MAG: hypothetical protein NVS9B6_17440 [Candidatus Limnocylindrales bacterium]